MLKTEVVIIGGGATGAGILRDLSLRGIKAILVERGDLGCGTSSRFHGLLHSGARYAVRDQNAAIECIEENQILRKIATHCVEPISSIFIRTPEDDPEYEGQWVDACARAGISAKPMTVEEALTLEPNLSPKIQAAYLCPGAAIDGFRLLWHIFDSSLKLGGQVMTYTNVTKINSSNGVITGVTVHNKHKNETFDIACDYLINASGPWVSQVAKLADIEINVKPSKGTLIAFNHRISTNVIHRLHKPSDADIFVPHGTVTILGTTSIDSDPDDNSTSQDEVKRMMEIGKATFEDLEKYRILRVFAGCRPLYAGDDSSASGRNVSRDFVALDHGTRDGLKNFMSVCGGKFTTHRQMAEKVCDMIAPVFNNTAKCVTATTPLVPEPSQDLLERARKVFPTFGIKLAEHRQGAERFAKIISDIERDKEKGEIICECENVSRAEIEMVAKESTTHSISDLRRRTRLGMGTCQGTFCTYRAVGTVQEVTDTWTKDTKELFKEFLEARWKGIRPVMWANQLRDVELTRGIYEVSLNITHQNASLEEINGSRSATHESPNSPIQQCASEEETKTTIFKDVKKHNNETTATAAPKTSTVTTKAPASQKTTAAQKTAPATSAASTNPAATKAAPAAAASPAAKAIPTAKSAPAAKANLAVSKAAPKAVNAASSNANASNVANKVAPASIIEKAGASKVSANSVTSNKNNGAKESK